MFRVLLVVLPLCWLATRAQCAITSTATYTFPGFDETGLSQSIALHGNAGNTRLYKLISNSTYGALLMFTRSTVTGELTPSVSNVNTITSFSRPCFVGCTDVKATAVAVYVACSQVVVNGSFTELSRVLVLSPTTLGQLQSQRNYASAFGASGGSIALVGSTVTSLLLGTSVVGFSNFPSVSLVDGALPAATAVSGTPISEGVHGIEGAVIWWGNTNSVTPGWKCFARSSSGVVSSSGSSAFGSGANIAAIYGMYISPGNSNIYSVELPTGEFRPRFRTYSLSYNVGGGTPPPPVVPSGSPVYNYYPDTAARYVYMPSDDRHIYVLSNSSLYEYRRSASANNGGVPLEVTTAATSLVEPNGIVASSDGLFVYVASGAGVVALARDARTANPSLTSPIASGRYANIPLAYALPEAPSANVKVTIAGSQTFVLTMAQTTTVSTTVVCASPSSSASVVSVSPGGVIADGAYTVTLTYQDVYSNEPASSSSISITVDTVTQTPTFTSPANSAIIRSTAVSLQYTLAEACSAGTVTFLPRNGLGATVVWTLGSSGLTSGAKSATINSAAVSGIVASATGGVLDGVYDVVLSVVDLVGNAAASVTRTPVTARPYTKAPIWVSPAQHAALSAASNTWTVSLPTPATVGTLQLTFTPRTGSATTLVLNYPGSVNGTFSTTFDISNPTGSASVSSGSAFAAGEYNVTISMQDDALNTANSSTLFNVAVNYGALAISATGITSSGVYDRLVFNATVPVRAFRSQLTIRFTNNNYTKDIVVALSDPTATLFRITRLNVSNPDAVGQVVVAGGSFVSTLPTGSFPLAYLNQRYNVYLTTRDYADRFEVSTTVATDILLTTAFCTLTVLAPCTFPEYAACVSRCATDPSVTANPVTVYVTSETTTTVVVVQTVHVPVIVVREGKNYTFYNTTTTTNTVRIPVDMGWSDAAFYSVLSVACFLAAVIIGTFIYWRVDKAREDAQREEYHRVATE